jgi:hypothetical protein
MDHDFLKYSTKEYRVLYVPCVVHIYRAEKCYNFALNINLVTQLRWS